MVVHGNNLLVHGGTGLPFGTDLSNAVTRCNLLTLQWMELKPPRNERNPGDCKPEPGYGQVKGLFTLLYRCTNTNNEFIVVIKSI